MWTENFKKEHSVTSSNPEFEIDGLGRTNRGPVIRRRKEDDG